MDIFRIKYLHRLIVWKTRRHCRPSELNSFAGVTDHDDTGCTQTLLSREESLRKWCRPASEKVPRGFVPVYVGSEGTRFVIPMMYLSMPHFRKLMDSTADEFGFEQAGGLKLACEEDEFGEALRKCLAVHKTKTKTGRKLKTL